MSKGRLRQPGLLGRDPLCLMFPPILPIHHLVLLQEIVRRPRMLVIAPFPERPSQELLAFCLSELGIPVYAPQLLLVRIT